MVHMPMLPKQALIISLLIFSLYIPNNGEGCTSDSLRVLSRVYPVSDWPVSDYLVADLYNDLLREQSDCFSSNRKTAIDTAFHTYGTGWYRALFSDVLDSLLIHRDNDSNATADIFYLKGLVGLEPIIWPSRPDTVMALEYFDSTLTYNRQYHSAWYNKGVVYLALGEPETATDCFRNAIAQDNTQMHYWLHYGVAQHRLGLKDETRRALDSAVHYSSKSVESFEFLATELRLLQVLDESIRFLDSALARDDDNPDLWFAYGMCVYRIDSTEDVEHYLDSALRLCENDSALLNYFVHVPYLASGEHALRFLDKALSINRYRVYGWFYKIRLLASLGNLETAVDCMDSVIKYDTANSFPEDDLFKGWQLSDFGKFEEALVHLEKINAKTLDSDWIETFFCLRVSCYHQLGRYGEAALLCDSLSPPVSVDSCVKTVCDSIDSKLR